MRLVVFGGWGQLGSDLFSVAARRHDLVRPTHAEVDVTDARAVARAVRDARPDAVIDAAAFHQTQRCEEEPERAFAVNATGALHVARAARAAGARCVFVSTDYVFDGENPHGYAEDDPMGPINVYGATKVAGELLARIGCRDSLVVRGSGMFGHAGSSGKGGNFVEKMLASASAGHPLTVVEDQVFAPTSTHDLAERLVALLEVGAPAGNYHLVNEGTCSWYSFAAKVLELAGIEASITPRSTGDQEVRRPRWSVLRDTKTVKLGLPPARPWEEALRWYLDTRPARQAASACGEHRH